jgi:DUF4097 and DUF4098 domain-containing protein YvlB
MPKFDTPQPVSVTIDRIVGDVRIVAGDRSDTDVEVRPKRSGRPADIRAAENTQVEYRDGRLLVKGPRLHTMIGRVPSIAVTIELPAGSHVEGDSDLGDFIAEGRLGDCRFKTAMGHIRLGEVGSLDAETAMGDVTVGSVAGDADISTASGEVRIDRIGGTAKVKNSNGANRLGEVGGDLLVRTANGDISVDSPRSSVIAKTANGDVRVGEVTRGRVVLETAAGGIHVGVNRGTAAWLDIGTQYGVVRNDLDPSDAPGQSEASVDVRARTSFGDIVISRSA